MHSLNRNIAAQSSIRMYSLKEFWQIRNLPEPEGEWDGNVICIETTFLLRQTSLSITQISDQLHFAEVTPFARFFNRMKGINPRDFRKGK